MAVLHPLESRMHQTKARAKRILFAVWLAPSLVASPFLYPAEAFANDLQSSYGSISRLTCFVRLPEDVRKGYYTFLFVAIYCLPLLFIGGTCVQVARCLLKDIPVHRQGSVRRQEANRRKVAKMVLMVVLAFAVCWTPYFLVSIITQYQAVNFMEKENFFFTMLNINLFAFLNSCVNPFIYAAMSTRFRNGFLRCFAKFLCCGSSPEVATGLDMMADRTKRVRFRCQPTCLIAHSSSDGGGSNVASDTSQRTACTVDINGRRNGGSILRPLGKGRPCTPKKKLIARYIKKGSSIHFGDNSYNLENKLNALAETTRVIHRRCSSSTGDVSTLVNGVPCCEDLVAGHRKWSSCLTVNCKDSQMA